MKIFSMIRVKWNSNENPALVQLLGFALFVFLVSRDCCVALPNNATS